MKYSIYKLSFHTGIHLGSGKLSDGESVIHADTLFSALCLEALRMGGQEEIEKLVKLVESDKLRFSDGLPYIGDTLYLPKPMIAIEGSSESNSVEKKAYKRLKYIPEEQFDAYLEGYLDVQKENQIFSEGFGEFSIRTMVNLQDEEDAMPYNVGVFQFQQNAGIYFLFAFEHKDDKKYLDELFDALAFTGIGGKRSSGLGKFTVTTAEAPQGFEERLDNKKEGQSVMALSVCLPEEEELEVILRDASYGLIKRSGFVSSETYARAYEKKRDLVVFTPGSCFGNRFNGVLSDVSAGGSHPVYSYGKSLMMRIN